jgi:predicted AAA+ superfamily ATPase
MGKQAIKPWTDLVKLHPDVEAGNASRVDQLRKPVSGDEVLHVLHRRLLGEAPSKSVAQEMAESYGKVVIGMQMSHAESLVARQHAEEEGLALVNRIKAAYPFHPALIDVMRERWASVDPFQWTGGALKFLSCCLHALKKDGGARALLGPAEVPLRNVEVRMRMLNCFKKNPNVTKLVEDAEQEVTREDTANPKAGPVRRRIKELLDERLAGRPAIVWPEESTAIPNDEPRFLVAYVPLELAGESKAEQGQAPVFCVQRPRSVVESRPP